MYGPTLEKDGNYYSVRFVSAFDIRGAEQWYHMNKAKNFDEFQTAVKEMKIPGLNIIYADKENNIMFLDNGHFPRKNKNYDWWHVVPGDTSATLWKANDYYGFDSLAKVINPKCGYVFNNNNTPFNCTAKEDNLDRNSSPLKENYFRFNDNRALRTGFLFANSGKISYDEFKKIKYDQSFMDPAYNYAMTNIEDILHLDEKKYPQIKASILLMKNWNRSCDVNNKQAAMVALVIHFVIDRLVEEGNFPATQTKVKEWFLVKCVEDAQAHLLKHFGKLDIPLGDLQKLVRGKKELPVGGVRDEKALQRLAVPTSNGIHFIDIHNIIWMEGDGSYTKFKIEGKSNLMASKSLKEYEDILIHHSFVRVHQSYLINISHINKYIKGDGGQLIMSDGTEIEVSRRKKDELKEILKSLSL